MAWSREALEIAAVFKPRAYFIFSFDMVPIAQMEQNENSALLKRFGLSGGPENFSPVVVSVRLNPSSPYRVEARDGSLVLEGAGRAIGNVELQRSPDYYKRTLANGKPIMDIARRSSGATSST